MQTVQMGDLTTSNAVLGCMRLVALDEKQADALIRAALDLGVTLFDHADIYGGGGSETLFGSALRKDSGLRGKMHIQTKCGICRGYYDLSKEHIVSSVEGSLARLGTDRIDLLLLHRPDALMEPDEIAEAFAALEKSGKVLRFGVSNMSAAQISLLQKALPQKLIANQIQFGLMHAGPAAQGIHVNTADDEASVRDGEVLPYCMEHDIAVQAWSPFQYGVFEGTFLGNTAFPKANEALAEVAAAHGVTPSAIALAWILRHPAKMQVILGTTSAKHLEEACQGRAVRLSRQEWYKLYMATGHRLP